MTLHRDGGAPAPDDLDDEVAAPLLRDVRTMADGRRITYYRRNPAWSGDAEGSGARGSSRVPGGE